MIIHNPDQTFSFSLFRNFPELVCRISTRSLGDMDLRKYPKGTALPLISAVEISPTDIIVMEQIHGSQVAIKHQEGLDGIVLGVDGIVSNAKHKYVGVLTADCVPLFFYDPVLHIFGTAHAGWKGTLLGISKNVIQKMEELGSTVKDILVAIGPHIGGCCYTIPEDRALSFIESFGRYSWVSFQNRDNWFLDLGQANRLQLLERGILPDHLDTPIQCTSCQNDLFFSYRKDSKETFGEILGIIGMRA